MNLFKSFTNWFSDTSVTDVNKFPENFLWGTATAAFQIEGHPEEYSQKLSDWAHWLDRADKVKAPNGGGAAIRHYEHLEEDLNLINGLGAGAYRFSFNWAALHRAPDEFDELTLEFYHNLLEGLKVKPFATLVHFVLPNWLAEAGGWENPNTACEFNNFVKFLLENFGDKISHWITFNEPNIFLGFGYESGIWPPGKVHDYNGYFKAYQGMLTAHELAYKSIKQYNPNHQVGFSQNMYYFQAASELSADELNSKSLDSPQKKLINLDKIPVVIRDQLHNYSFIEACLGLGSLDFLGVNYYTRFTYKFSSSAKDPADPHLDSFLWGDLQKNENSKYNSLGWELYPEGLYRVLASDKFRKLLGDTPVFITENGYCHVENDDEERVSGASAGYRETLKDLDDTYRINFINEHLAAVLKAIKAGVNIQGYFYWSLIDNFEWALGMNPRFGLIHVDLDTYKRTPKASYYHYSKICKTSSLEKTQSQNNS